MEGRVADPALSVYRTGSAAKEFPEETAALARFTTLMSGAPVTGRDTPPDRVNVLATTGPGRLATLATFHCSAHGAGLLWGANRRPREPGSGRTIPQGVSGDQVDDERR